MNALNLHKICCLFSLKGWAEITFYKLYKRRKKIQKHKDTQKKITQKLLSQTYYKNYDICIL